MVTTFKSKSVQAKKRALAQGTAWIIGALVVGFVDLRLLAIPVLGLAGVGIAAVMAIIGIRKLQWGMRLGPYDLLALASEKEGGLLNSATIVQAFGCTPESAIRAMHEGLNANLFEDVTPPAGKTLIIRSLATENLSEDVERGQEDLARAMEKLEAELTGDLDLGLESARKVDAERSQNSERREGE